MRAALSEKKLIKNTTFLDLLIIVFSFIIILILLIMFDISEWFANWLYKHEKLGVDELTILIIFFIISLSTYSFRRWFELRSEIKQRKRAENNLRKSKDSLSEAQRIAHLGNWEWNIQTNEMYWSDEIYRIFGSVPQEFAPTYEAFVNFVHPDDREKAKKTIEDAINGKKPYIIDHRILRPDEEERIVREQAEFTFDEAGRPIQMVGTVQDITDLKRSERRIRVSLAVEKMLREIDHMIMQRRPMEEIFCVVCRGTLDMGYRMAWVGLAEPDHTVRLVAHEGFEENYLKEIRIRWDDTPEGRGPTGTAIRTGEPFVMRDIQGDPRFASWRKEAMKRGYRSSASIPFKLNNQVMGTLNVYSTRPDDFGPEEIKSFLGVAQQVTIAITHRKTSEELERTRERLQAIFDNAMEGIFLVELMPDGDFRYAMANAAFGRICGIDVIGKTPEESFPPDVAAAMTANYRQVLAKGRPLMYEVEYGFASGRRCLWKSMVPLADQKMIIGIARDITAAKDQERRFQQIQRLESIGRLAGGIAHDFNNLVTVIIGYAQLAAAGLPENSPLIKDLEEIRNAAERASSLIRQLLAFSRRQILQKEAVDLNGIVIGMEKMLRRVIGEHIEIKMSLTEGLQPVMADPGQLEQVIMNLAVNARDAMPGGGMLILETVEVELDRDYAGKHPGVKPGRYAMLAVSDTGCGMSREIQERIFEPFFTTKEMDKGTGLGLSTVYGIVKQPGGNIWAYSEEGKGTTFKVYLPVAAKIEPSSPRSESPDALPRGTETILLVEDEEKVRNIAQRILSHLGYHVLAVRNAQEAMETLSSSPGTVLHLMVTDVVMPGMSGFELARRVTERRPKVKVLFMSGYSEEMMINHGILPPDRFLQKPFSPDRLAQKVREVLDKEN